MMPPLSGSCADCRHFNARPLDIEAALPGLSTLSSAYAAVRSNDGICAVHDRYVAASSVCAQHRALAPSAVMASDTDDTGKFAPGPGTQSASTCTRQS
jgi:hypothetical protein